MLYPQTNSKRLATQLDGIWDFIKDSKADDIQHPLTLIHVH